MYKKKLMNNKSLKLYSLYEFPFIFQVPNFII